MINSNNNLSLIPSALDCSQAIMKGVSSLPVIFFPPTPPLGSLAALPEGGPWETKSCDLKSLYCSTRYQLWKRFCKEKCCNCSLKYGLEITVEFICAFPFADPCMQWMQRWCFFKKKKIARINSQWQLFNCFNIWSIFISKKFIDVSFKSLLQFYYLDRAHTTVAQNPLTFEVPYWFTSRVSLNYWSLTY